jgi:D-alanyl-D-alanine carboxypeptidase
MKPTSENNFLFFILFILALEAALFSVGNNKLNTTLKNEENDIKRAQNVLADIPIQAKAISVYDESLDKKIYGKNDEVSLPIASLTKIMTVIIALNNYGIDDTVSISQNALKQDTNYGFLVNEKFKIKDLTEFTLVGSANDGAYALAENIDNFLEKMNAKAQKIGMKDSSFFNSTGLDIDVKTTGAYASAQDVNVMAGYALKAYPEIFSVSIMPEINIKSLSGFNHNIKNTDIILDKIPGILFSKTGYTPLSGGNLTIIYKNKYGHNIAITVLGSTQDGRFSDMEKIVDTLYDLDYGSGN